MKKRIAPYLFLTILSVLCGCASTRYELVKAQVVTDIDTSLAPSVTKSPNLATQLSGYKKIVVSHPSMFLGESASEHGGIQGSAVLLKDESAIWVTEIEKQFLEKGFTVLSRQKIQELLWEKQVTSAEQAATLLGADAIVQINSLEYNPSLPLGQRTKVNLSFFNSDAQGTPLTPLKHSAYMADRRKGQIMDLLHGLIAPHIQMALLDAKVIDAKTGEIVFFYRSQTYSLPPDYTTKLTQDFLFAYSSDALAGYNETLIDPKTGLRQSTQSSPGESDSVSFHTANDRTVEMDAKLRADTIANVCRDFIDRLLSEKKPPKTP
jgi:hypothetical protein